ncbi:DUF6568 family protein [Enterococcus mundtii]|uniref:DUF6568 family protein n=1 Tax=Enterococcus TaxID=1350 RepID=UPI0008E8E46B|nr:DUF6568 family protein [Enterococcus mundtii]SFM23629.1 hypothetical protein SAMN04487758_11531 [Enterococcus mundtii]
MSLNKFDKTKIVLCLIGIFIILLLVTIFKIQQDKLNQIDKSLQIEKNNVQIYQDIISYPINTFENKVSNGDLMFVYMGNLECSDCSAFYPIFKEKFKEFNLENKLSYIECSYLRTNKSEWLKFKEKYGFSQTPAFIIYKNSKILSNIEWDNNNGLNEVSFSTWLSENKKIIDSISL